MPLQETSGAASYDAFGGGAAAVPNYIEDVFSTWLYTGNGSTQTITNGIDLAGEGGLVWVKQRNSSSQHVLRSTGMDATEYLRSNAVGFYGGITTTFNADGFTTSLSVSPETYASWTFRKQAKFFDVVTYTGNGSNRTISHNLGSIPGCIIVKRLGTADWQVYHRSLANTEYMVLNTNSAKSTGTTRWNSTTPTSTEFSLGTDANVNTNGATYVAYLFAHNAGGFGLSGTDDVISCGSYTGNGSATGPVVTLEYEPQWIIIKDTTNNNDWQLLDNMRGLVVGGTDAELNPNNSDAESTGTFVSPLSDGFRINTTAANYNGNGSTYIYIAIRRGPMKVPTTGTSVFSPTTYTGNATYPRTIGSLEAVDFSIIRDRTGAYWNEADRLRGGNARLFFNVTDAETTWTSSSFAVQNGFVIGSVTNDNAVGYINYAFRRASGFMDVVCYTGNGTSQNINHNLAAVPEMMIVKSRSGTYAWNIYNTALGATQRLLFTSAAVSTHPSWNDTTPTSTVFSVGATAQTNIASGTYVAYLFATVAGVSKVGTYTGTGTGRIINCGFTGGARFVLIKRADSTGDWYVWDSARGIVAGNDPYLLLNSAAAEVTNTAYIDTYSAGFEISSTATAAINTNGGTYIFLAIA